MRFVFQDRRGAQPGLPPDLGDIQSVVRLEPNAVVVDDADDRDWDVEAPRGNRGDTIKGAVGGCIEDVVAPNGGEPGAFIIRQREFLRASNKRHGRLSGDARTDTALNSVAAYVF